MNCQRPIGVRRGNLPTHMQTPQNMMLHEQMQKQPMMVQEQQMQQPMMVQEQQMQQPQVLLQPTM